MGVQETNAAVQNIIYKALISSMKANDVLMAMMWLGRLLQCPAVQAKNYDKATVCACGRATFSGWPVRSDMHQCSRM